MKAYQCGTQFECYSTIVFAETRGKAKVIAMNSDSLGDDLEFIDIWVRRCPVMDQFYRGRSELDWYDPEDRIAMVKVGGYSCDDDSFDPDDCEKCPAKDYCGRFEEWKEEEGERE